jgi:hypothetical protein
VPGGLPNTNVNIANNDIDRVTNDGIGIAPNSLMTSTISNNEVEKSGRDGIHIEAPGNAGNVISRNNLKNNGRFDCFDATTGMGTAGTANTWVRNTGKTSSPPGLCRPE